jgi:RsmE family RNA methyltransferase
MNLVLLFKNDFINGTNRVRLIGRRLNHVMDVHKASPGEFLTVGLENGDMGKGLILSLTKESLDLEISLEKQPPSPLPLNLIIALPRPKVLNRIIISATSMGVKKIWLINAYRVEKSYWQSPRLSDENLLNQRILGLEQAKDTLMPEIVLKSHFKPFVEDELPGIIARTLPLVAHPISDTPCPIALNTPITLAIGPEGGFIPYEIERLTECGFSSVHLGERILRVETTIPALIARLFS